MTDHSSVAASGTFKIGGDMSVHRLGFGAMRITGPGIWGEPQNPDAARATLRRVAELGIDLIDTADSYGPFVSERLIHEVLHPYPAGMHIATKGSQARPGPNQWVPVGKPAYLRQCVHMSLRRLGVDCLDLWQLHRIDPQVPREDQFQEMADLRKEGLIRHLGLSEVSIEDIEEAQRHFPVATVQNQFSLAVRKNSAVLAYCTRHNIAFIPWRPLDAGPLAQSGSVLHQIAQTHGVTPQAIAVAWLLAKSPVMLPIPGTSNPHHLDDNVRGAEVKLSDAEFKALDEAVE